LDDLDTIKLVNYIRSEVKAGNSTPDVSSKDKFEDDAYLKPVLEDDALLYSLGDIADEEAGEVGGTQAERQVIALQEELERLQVQFSEYRVAVQKSLEEQLTKEDEKLASTPDQAAVARAAKKTDEVDSDYFSSYSYNGMLSRSWFVF
jgi:protein arginine N-methyltransferase 3